MHDTEWESGIQNSEQLKPQSFAHNITKFNLKKKAAKRARQAEGYGILFTI